MSVPALEILQRMPIFGGVRGDILEFLLAESEQISLLPGQRFCGEGDRAAALFVLESGRAEVVKAWQGREYLIKEFRRGDCFGEMSLIDLEPRSASVVALTACTAIKLSKALLLRISRRDLEQFTLIQMNVARELSRRLRATDRMLFAELVAADKLLPHRGGASPDRARDQDSGG